MRNITIALTLILAVIFLTPIFLGLTRIRHRKFFLLIRLLQILIFLGLLLMPTLRSMGIDVEGVIENKISVGLESVRIAFVKVFGSLFFSDAYDGTVWIAVAVSVTGGIIFLRRRRQKR